MYFSLFPIFNCGCPQYSIEGELSGNLARVVERSIPRQTFEHLQPPVMSKMPIISFYLWPTCSRIWHILQIVFAYYGQKESKVLTTLLEGLNRSEMEWLY